MQERKKKKLQSWVIKGHYVVLKKKRLSSAPLNSKLFFWVCVWTQLNTYSKFIFHGIFKRHEMYGSGVGSRFRIHQYFQEGALSIGIISTAKWKTGSRCFWSVVLWHRWVCLASQGHAPQDLSPINISLWGPHVETAVCSAPSPQFMRAG